MTALRTVSTLSLERISVPSPSVGTEDGRLPIPRTAADCELLLEEAERRRSMGMVGVADDLARFLGATASIWTAARKRRLWSLLANTDGIRAVLASVAKAPNAEAIDDAVRVLLTDASDERVDLFAALLEGAPIPFPGFSDLRDSLEVRITLVRALGQREAPLSANEERGLARALRDPASDVRDAAAQAIARRDAQALLPALREMRRQESDALVAESMDDALASLSA